MSEPSPTIPFELGNLMLRLREDLDFTAQEYSGRVCYVVRDASTSHYFQIGTAEYTFLSLLDGQTTLQEAVHLTSGRLGADAFHDNDAAAICRWLLDNQLVEVCDQPRVQALLKAGDRSRLQHAVSRIHPLVIRMPLGDPDPWIERLEPWLGWMTCRTFLLIWLTVVGLAVVRVFEHWDRLCGELQHQLIPASWLWLVLVWIGLKLIHEAAHGIFCRRFGGRTREAGLVFILLAPIPYVDVTSAWGFVSKWQRIATSAAGMYIELFCAAVATILWSHSTEPLIRFHALNVMLTAGLVTFLFNANFLMRFDGYYLLADLLEMPNLYSLGHQDVIYLARRYLLGIKTSPPQQCIRTRLVIRAFGLSSLVWRVIVCTTLVLAAEMMFAGFGLILASLALLSWIAVPVARLATYATQGNSRERPSRWRLAIVAASAIAGVTAAFTIVPWPFPVAAPAMVRYAHPGTLRTAVAGFVREVRVRPGDRVQHGQILVVLESPELRQRLRDLQLALQQSQVRSRVYYGRKDVAALQAEASVQEGLTSREAECRQQVDSLIVRAPADGEILGVDLDSLTGRYLPPGAELLQVVDPCKMEVFVSLSQDKQTHFLCTWGRLPDSNSTVIPDNRSMCSSSRSSRQRT